MKSPIAPYLNKVRDLATLSETAANADYIPELARVNPQLFGIALATVDGQVYTVGDADVEFTIQSVSKPFVYALAIEDRGIEAVSEKIGVEPSGEAFNEISLEAGSKRPRNPMINAGAITAHTLVGDKTFTEGQRIARIIDRLSAFAGRQLTTNEIVAESERQTAHRNLAIGHMLRSYDILTSDPDVVVGGYVRQCAINVTARDLAVMVMTLANGGVQPVTGEQVVSSQTARHVLSVMLSCGMYNAAGDWLTSVGIPAKSGVGGGLIGALPGQIGLATFSPPLDPHGHSARGVKVFEYLSEDLGLHLMDVPPPARSVVRAMDVHTLNGEDVFVYDLQGDIRFAGIERVVRLIVDEPPTQHVIAFDLVDVHSLDEPAMRILVHVVRLLAQDGHKVWVVGLDNDPRDQFPDLPAEVCSSLDAVGATSAEAE